MLTPEQLDALPEAALELWRQVEEDILADMARRISRLGGLTDTAAWQAFRLEQTRLFRRDLVKRLSQTLGKSEAEIRRLLTAAGTQALAADDAIYRAAGLSPVPPNDSPALLNLLTAGARQTQGTFVNLTATTANTATGQFERALDRAWLQTASGAFDYQTAVRRCVSDLAASGLEAVHYPSGHVDTLEVAVRRAVITGVNQTAGRLQAARMEEMGCDLVEVTAHAGARPSHAEWQGKIFSRSGTHPKYPPFSRTGYGTGAGLCGWNCRHNFYPFFEGLSEPVYTEARLNQLNARDIEYQGRKYTRYEINQMQRYRERRVRRWKRQFVMEEAAGLDSTQSAVKLAHARTQLRQFANDTGGRVDSARVSVNGFGQSEASRATRDAGLTRRTGNPGVFSALPERMSKKHIREVASEFGISLKGITLVIDTDTEKMRPSFLFAGRADPQTVGRVDFFPHAFSSREELTRTLFHEIMHVAQFKQYGADYVQAHRAEFEELTYTAENVFIERLKKEGKL